MRAPRLARQWRRLAARSLTRSLRACSARAQGGAPLVAQPHHAPRQQLRRLGGRLPRLAAHLQARARRRSASLWSPDKVPHVRSARSARWSGGASAVYAVWIHIVRVMNGAYPYGFLNLLPHPHGPLAFSVFGFALFGVVFVVRHRACTHAAARCCAARG